MSLSGVDVIKAVGFGFDRAHRSLKIGDCTHGRANRPHHRIVACNDVTNDRIGSLENPAFEATDQKPSGQTSDGGKYRQRTQEPAKIARGRSKKPVMPLEPITQQHARRFDVECIEDHGALQAIIIIFRSPDPRRRGRKTLVTPGSRHFGAQSTLICREKNAPGRIEDIDGQDILFSQSRLLEQGRSKRNLGRSKAQSQAALKTDSHHAETEPKATFAKLDAFGVQTGLTEPPKPRQKQCQRSDQHCQKWRKKAS
ncbi:MAG: hypothetical protein WCN85_01360 [Burkholderiales bacterium]